MKHVSILENDDAVKPTDWCRPLSIVSGNGGHSDDYFFTSQYSGQPENNARWVHVDQIFGEPWFGKKVSTLNSIGIQYEFVRGDVPENNQYGKTNRDYEKDYDEMLKQKISKGKYRGKTWEWVKSIDENYFGWAEREGFAPIRKRDFGR